MPLIGEVDVGAISTTISDTAVDVFIYDTRKDSDGGAWRKRTQNTSWYNETLNTSTRGSRKEFPAVAVIVAESNQVTIYDGDDPSLPMWMVFNESGNHTSGYQLGHGTIKSVSITNGLLITGKSNTGFVGISFIEDTSVISGLASGTAYPVTHSTPIAERNVTKTHTAIGWKAIVADTVNDVAMTVLPNAPIDNDTGLPVPTIAVATSGGVSVIKDDGTTVVDITFSSYGASNLIDFIDVDKIIFANDSGSRNRHIKVYSIPTSDISEGVGYDDNNALEAYQIESSGSAQDLTFFSGVGTTNNLRRLVKRNFGQQKGLTKVSPNIEIPSNGMMTNITSDHNTGWMNGDIKLAILSDTDDTNITGSELADVTNASDYNDNSGKTTIDATSNPATITFNAGNPAWWGFIVRNLTVGKTYVLTWETTNQVDFVRANSVSGTTVDSGTSGAITFVATGTTKIHYFSMYSGQSPNTFTATCRLAVPDRSYNNNGLQIFGTVNKNAVATGADLVSYSGFSSSNYLQQPHNSDLEFSTNDWVFSGWYYGASSNTSSTIFELANSVVAGTHIGVRYDNTNNLELFISDDGFSSQDVAEYAQTPSNTWQFFCAIRRGNVVELWNNGELKVSTTLVNATTALVDSTAFLRIGNRTYVNQPFGGSLALFRASATAPSEEQIKKIYNDEKFLFQENAKATLYGTSNDVVALAYDDTTKLLHAGTSNGRSVFNGLRRVDNTTDAVGASISASNGLVVDE